MPRNWEIQLAIDGSKEIVDPAAFYTPGRLAGLPTSLVRVINLSQQAAAN